MIHADQVTFAYPSTQESIFLNFSWTVGNSESWTVLGPSGCGKTTLLYLLSGLLLPDKGIITINEERLLRPRPRSGLILQDYGLLPWATVYENCELGIRLRAYYGADGIHAPQEKQSRANTEYWLEKMGLTGLKEKYPSQLSGGQRQRTAIARTLNLGPDLLLMDEPFSSLDAPTRGNLQELTLELIKENGLTLVLVTHSIEEAVFLGKNILLLGNPPNEKGIIIENPNAGEKYFRNSNGFIENCRYLREQMGES